MPVPFRSAFRRLAPVARRDERIRELEQRLANGDILTRPSYRARVDAERRVRQLGQQMGLRQPA